MKEQAKHQKFVGALPAGARIVPVRDEYGFRCFVGGYVRDKTLIEGPPKKSVESAAAALLLILHEKGVI